VNKGEKVGDLACFLGSVRVSEQSKGQMPHPAPVFTSTN